MKKVLRFCGKAAKYSVKFSLLLLAGVLADSAKAKEHEPTFQELTYGEKIPGSDKYYIPDEKHNN